MGCYGRNSAHWENKMERMQAHWDHKMDRMRQRMQGGSFGGSRWSRGSSGSSAFDEYKAETLRRLEEEQNEFREFLNRLRTSKDRTEFDAFMDERRKGGDAGATSEPQA